MSVLQNTTTSPSKLATISCHLHCVQFRDYHVNMFVL